MWSLKSQQINQGGSYHHKSLLIFFGDFVASFQNELDYKSWSLLFLFIIIILVRESCKELDLVKKVFFPHSIVKDKVCLIPFGNFSTEKDFCCIEWQREKPSKYHQSPFNAIQFKTFIIWGVTTTKTICCYCPFVLISVMKISLRLQSGFMTATTVLQWL